MKFDIDGMKSNVLPLINTANKGIERIEAKINAITIPSKFKSKDKIQSLKGKVGSIKGKILGNGIGRGIEGKINAKISKVQGAESLNKALLDSLGGIILKNKDATKKYIKDTSETLNKNMQNGYKLAMDNKNTKNTKSNYGNVKKVESSKPNKIRTLSNKINKNLGDNYKIDTKTKNKVKINKVNNISTIIGEFAGKTRDKRKVILKNCQEATDHFLEINAEYSLGDVENGDGPLIEGDIKSCWNHKYICCATYVSLVLYNSGVFTADYMNTSDHYYNGCYGVEKMLQDAGWEQISWDEAQAGDVAIAKDHLHVVIYAGDGKVWDQNTCTGVKKLGPFKPDYDLKGTYDVWSSPNEENNSIE